MVRIDSLSIRPFGLLQGITAAASIHASAVVLLWPDADRLCPILAVQIAFRVSSISKPYQEILPFEKGCQLNDNPFGLWNSSS